ncbi:MAG TPA: aminotransferase class I/II-fold pyridoxal phosphate-dependent enzyme [Thermoanaerobaculia bacterium]|nr:aminotransferase class I/II-fold pyridoxal phosphate-dependent enzyme [Thermoanaerobaculia bacterium]
MKFETLAVHAGQAVDPATGSVAPPIYLSTTFARDPEGVPIGGHTYIRESNPNETQLENALAALEGGGAALVFASGMAAGVALLQTLSPGSHVVFPEDVYYGYRATAEQFLPSWGISSSFVDMSDLAAFAAAIRPDTRLVWLESPSNPLLKVTDIQAAVDLAGRSGALTVIDNTFATPVLQRPVELGVDVILHSTTKYFGGHSDVQGGALVFARRDDLVEKADHLRHVLGAVASPFNCWLVLRGLRSLACRVAVQSAGALAVANALSNLPGIGAVHYPGLPSNPGHEIAKRQMSAFGGILSFQLSGGREAALQTVGKVRLFTRATSLGGVESLIEHRATSEGPQSRTPQDLIRLSIGLEHPDDLIADLRQALQGSC